MSKKSNTKRTLVLTEIGRAHLDALFKELNGFSLPKENKSELATRFLLRCGFSERSLNRLKLLHGHETDADLLKGMQCLKKEDLFILLNNVREPVLMAENCHFSELPLGHVKGVLESTISILPGVTAIGRGKWDNKHDNITTPHPITLASVTGVFAACGPFSLWCHALSNEKPKRLEERYRLLLTDRLTTLLKALAAQCPDDAMIALKVPGLGAGMFAGKGMVRGRAREDMVKRQLDLALQAAIRALTPQEQARFAGICLDVFACNHPDYGSPLIVPALPVPYRGIRGSKCAADPIPESPEALLSSLGQNSQIKKRIAGKRLWQVAVTAADWMAKELCEGRRPQGIATGSPACSIDHSFGISTNAMAILDNAGAGDYSPESDENEPYANPTTGGVHVLGSLEGAANDVEQWEQELRPFLLELLQSEAIHIGTYRKEARNILDALYPGLAAEADATCDTIQSLKSQITKAKGVKYINAEDDDELRRLKEDWTFAIKRLSEEQTVLQMESVNETLPNNVSPDLEIADEALHKAEIDEKRFREAYKACQARKKETLLSQLKDAIKALRDNWKQTVLDRIKPTSDHGASKEAGASITFNDRMDAIQSRWEALRKEWNDLASRGSSEEKHTLVLSDIGQSHLIEFISTLRRHPVPNNMTVSEAERCLIGCGFSKRSIKRLCKLYNVSSEITLLKLMKKMDKDSLFRLINQVREPIMMSDKVSFTTLPFGHIKGVLESTVCVRSGNCVSMSGVFGEADSFLSLSDSWSDNALTKHCQTVWTDRFSMFLRLLAFQCADSNSIALAIPDMGESSLLGKVGVYEKATFVRSQLEIALKKSIRKLSPSERSKFACIYLGDRASYQAKDGLPTETALKHVIVTPAHWMAKELGGGQCASANDPNTNMHLMGSRMLFNNLPLATKILVKGLPQGVWTEEALRSYVGSPQGVWFTELYGADSQIDYGLASQYLMEKPFGLDRDNKMSAFVLRHLDYLREHQFKVLCDAAIRAGESREEARDRLDVRYPGLGEKADSTYTLIQRTQEQCENRKKQLIDLQSRSSLKMAWDKATAEIESIASKMKNNLGSLSQSLRDAKEEERRCKKAFDISIKQSLESVSKVFQPLFDSAKDEWQETVGLFREKVEKKTHQEGGKKSRGIFGVVPVRKEKDVQAQLKEYKKRLKSADADLKAQMEALKQKQDQQPKQVVAVPLPSGGFWV